MRIAHVLVLSFLFVSLSGPSAADESMESRIEAIQRLGKLNGVALACRYDEAVSRMKNAIILAAPKERVYGQAFDEASNEGFLAFVQAGEACPKEFRFIRRVEDAVGEVNTVFEVEGS